MGWIDCIKDAPIEWIGKNHTIEPNVHIGYNNLTRLREGYEKKSRTVKIGNNVTIREGSIIYAGCEIGDNVHIGHNVLLREFTKIGNNTSIGSGDVCEGYTYIGHDCRIQAQCHLTSNMHIGNYVFMGALVSTMNDKRMRYARSKIEDSPDIGPLIGNGCAIGSSVIILPKVAIQMGCIVGAGTLVSKDLELFHLYYGNPVRQIRILNPEEIVDKLLPYYKVYIKKLCGKQ